MYSQDMRSKFVLQRRAKFISKLEPLADGFVGLDVAARIAPTGDGHAPRSVVGCSVNWLTAGLSTIDAVPGHSYLQAVYALVLRAGRDIDGFNAGD